MFVFKMRGLHLAQATNMRNPKVPNSASCQGKIGVCAPELLSLRFQHNVRVFEGRQDPHLIDRILTELLNLGFRLSTSGALEFRVDMS